jgi:uncharacterized repeat protein (TIGR03806 family)
LKTRPAARAGRGALSLLPWLVAGACAPPGPVPHLAEPWPERLGDWRIFRDGSLEPSPGVLVYELNTALFSDYAAKLRTVWMPEGVSAAWRDEGPLAFPAGTVLSKTFWYPVEGDGSVRIDAASGGLGRRRVETRLLVRGRDGWVALPYLWNAEQSEAFLRPAGGLEMLRWSDGAGGRGELAYLVPNRDQCRSCHDAAGEPGSLRPIGTTAANLNRDVGAAPQLAAWRRRGFLEDGPDPADAPRLPVWDDPATGSTADRARAYLEVQCAHCHGPARPADASGLLLGFDESRPRALGICKPPVAAGRGSGGRLHDVVPGRPEESILYFRMQSREPDVMMPELGRDLRHEEGLALIRRWIDELEGDGCEAAGGGSRARAVARLSDG